MPATMQKVRIDNIRQNMSGLPNTNNKNFYDNFLASMNVFLATRWGFWLCSALDVRVQGESCRLLPKYCQVSKTAPDGNVSRTPTPTPPIHLRKAISECYPKNCNNPRPPHGMIFFKKEPILCSWPGAQ